MKTINKNNHMQYSIAGGTIKSKSPLHITQNTVESNPNNIKVNNHYDFNAYKTGQ